MGYPTISVVIPSFNNAPFIRHAIESALSQSLTPLEVIIVDDGSTDHTADVLRQFHDQIIVVTQQNSGPAVARNSGIAVARGEWVAFLDGDDYWFPEKLELQAPYLCDDVVQVGGVNQTQRGGECKTITRLTTPDFLCRVPWGMSSHVARLALLRQLGGFNARHRYPGAEDRELYLRLSVFGGSVRINTPVYHYRQHPGQGSRHPERMAASYADALRSFFTNHPEYQPWASSAYGYYHLDLAWAHYEAGQRLIAAYHLAASLCTHPGKLPHARRTPVAARILLGATIVHGLSQRRVGESYNPSSSP
jgi:glycosyltransferase involved in cell wall biosynthesis